MPGPEAIDPPVPVRENGALALVPHDPGGHLTALHTSS